MNWIFDFLAFSFESGNEYKTICTHRSSISALHSNIEGRSVGEHPQVSSLITGVFTNRPSRPKYNFTWDVQLVLDYLKKELSNNSNLSEKLLIFKVAMLLTLTSVFRVRGLHILDTRFMVKTLRKYVFNFHKPHKSWKQGQKVWSACRVILILWIKLRKDLILSSHPLHENYSTVTCIFSFV